MYKYFWKIGDTKSISEWKSKGLSDEIVKPPNNSLAPTVKYYGKRMNVKVKGSCFKQNKTTLNHGKTLSTYIVYDLKSNFNNFDPNLQNFLFRAVKLTKNNDIDKFDYSGYGIGFDLKGTFSPQSGGIGQNVIILMLI